MMPIIIDLPLPPKILHPNSRPHFRAKAKATKQTRAEAKMVASLVRPDKPMAAACYRLIFRLPRKMDYDGLGAWVKSQIDGIVDAGVLTSDLDFRPIGVQRITGQKDTDGRYGVRFEIWPEDEHGAG